MSLDGLLATHNVSSNTTLIGIGKVYAQHDIHNCSVVLLFFFNESENDFFSTQRAMHVNVSELVFIKLQMGLTL